MGSGWLTQISVILAAFALKDKSWGGNAYSLPGTPGEAGEDWETHSALSEHKGKASRVLCEST